MADVILSIVSEVDVPDTGTSPVLLVHSRPLYRSPRPSALAVARVPSIVLRRVGGAPMPQSGETTPLKTTIPSAKIQNP